MKRNLLEKFVNDSYISGETLAKQLHVSRTAIWKQIKSLEDQGYIFKSKRNKGYQLVFRPDIPIKEEIIPFIKTSIIGSQLYFHHTLVSTNSYGKELIKKDVPEGTVIIAEKQEKGRGRKERSWSSPKGGLWFSIILYPDISPQKAMHVTMIASIAVANAIQDICSINPEIKWPNDLMINGKKLCGILTEIDAEMDKIHYSIIGIGLNVNNKIPHLLNDTATSLKIVKKKEISRVQLLRLILTYFDGLYQYIIKNDLSFIRNIWIEKANIIGKKICVHGERESVTGIVTGIDDDGCLMVKKNNQTVSIVSGDIEYLNNL